MLQEQPVIVVSEEVETPLKRGSVFNLIYDLPVQDLMLSITSANDKMIDLVFYTRAYPFTKQEKHITIEGDDRAIMISDLRPVED